MPSALDRLLAFFVDNFPDTRTLAIGAPLGLLWALACLWLAAELKRRRRWRTGLTRKVFHFAIFATAALVQLKWGRPALCLFAGMTSVVVLWAIVRGDGHPLYEALAREADAPHRTYYIVVPWLATAAGGIAANVLFGRDALYGYLVGGLGDAVGEPVGVRLGRHRYRVLVPGLVQSTRSLEGSGAVLVASWLAVLMAHAALGATVDGPLVARALAIALCCALAEAVSPHGWDNLVLQVLPAWLASWIA